MSQLGQESLRVLVVDDSPYNRGVLTTVLEGIGGVEVVGRAKDGREALRLCSQLEPDLVTLDLEMPEMDGFMFLRLMTRRQSIPVLVVSGYSSRENVFRALELGAMDFVSAPSDSIAPDLRAIAEELGEKIALVKRVAKVRKKRHKFDQVAPVLSSSGQDGRVASNGCPPVAVVAIASSTGGPFALQRILSQLNPALPISVVIAQHMPAQYTHTFAARLDRQLPFRVKEGHHGERLGAGTVYLAPGGRHMRLEQNDDEIEICLVDQADPSVRAPHICPNADHLLRSVGQIYRTRTCCVVLTGMGDDGARGCQHAKGLGAYIIAQDPESAVVPGMPGAAIETGVVDEVVELAQIHTSIESFVERLGATLRISGS